MAHVLGAAEAFKRLAEYNAQDTAVCALDVRSEGEFAEGCFPHVQNVPILNDDHRHQVGLTYKKAGQAAAIELAMTLVAPLRANLIRSWQDRIQANQALGEETLLFCWRGGLRSKTAAAWLAESGAAVVRVDGGYKAMRRKALEVLADLPPFFVLSGMTGSGKTRLLKKLPHHLDLEGLACHRGSAFGLLPNETQPTQLGFENHLALAVSVARGPLVVEDESRRIGRVQLPEGMYEYMARSPFVLLEVSSRDRAANIYSEYIEAPLAQGTASSLLHQHMRDCSERIRRKLGGLRTDQVLQMVDSAFGAQDPESHYAWIEFLLLNYYDPLYRFAMERKGVSPAFSGGPSECQEFLRETVARALADESTVHT